MANTPFILDIYSGDNSSSPKPIDFAAVFAAGYLGVIHKASEGTYHIDNMYAERRIAAKAAGLKWGAYHFMAHEDGEAQADYFLAAAQPDADTLLACDWENDPGKSTYPSKAIVEAFCQRIFDKLGRWPVLYSGNVAKEALGDKPDPFFAKLKLWLCQYSNTWKVQASWQYPWLWQNNGDSYGPGPHTCPGIKGLVDNNTFVAPMSVELVLEQWSQ